MDFVFPLSDVTSVIAVIISLIALGLTLYFNHLKGPDIQLLISDGQKIFSRKVIIKRQLSISLHEGLNTLTLHLDCVIMNRGNRDGVIFRIIESDTDKTNTKLIPSHELGIDSSPKVLKSKESLPIRYSLEIRGDKKEIEMMFKTGERIEFLITYVVTTRRSIKAKKLPVRIELTE